MDCQTESTPLPELPMVAMSRSSHSPTAVRHVSPHGGNQTCRCPDCSRTTTSTTSGGISRPISTSPPLNVQVAHSHRPYTAPAPTYYPPPRAPIHPPPPSHHHHHPHYSHPPPGYVNSPYRSQWGRNAGGGSYGAPPPPHHAPSHSTCHCCGHGRSPNSNQHAGAYHSSYHPHHSMPPPSHPSHGHGHGHGGHGGCHHHVCHHPMHSSPYSSMHHAMHHRETGDINFILTKLKEEGLKKMDTRVLESFKCRIEDLVKHDLLIPVSMHRFGARFVQVLFFSFLFFCFFVCKIGNVYRNC